MESAENRDYIGIIISGLIHCLLLFIGLQMTFTRTNQQKDSLAVEVVFEQPRELLSEQKEIVPQSNTPVSVPKNPVPAPAPKTVQTNNVGTKPGSASNGSASEARQDNSEVVASRKKQYGTLFGNKPSSSNGSGEGDDPRGEGALAGISKGNGIIGGGLAGRKAIEIPAVSENSQKTGRVVIKVCVAKDGKVVSAKFTQQGSTTSDPQLVKLAERAANKYLFSSAEIETQCGTITFDFKLQ